MGDTLLSLDWKGVKPPEQGVVSPDLDEETLSGVTGVEPPVVGVVPPVTRDESDDSLPVVHRNKLVPAKFLERLLRHLGELERRHVVSLSKNITHKRTLHIVGSKELCDAVPGRGARRHTCLESGGVSLLRHTTEKP